MNINTENIKLIVCDIDNTLIPSGSLSLSEHNRTALQKAIAKGIKVMINSGRHYTFLQPSLFDDLPMDVIGTINGACLTDRTGKVLEKHPMSEENMNAITKICIENGIGLGFKFEDRIVTYANHQKFMDGYVQKDAPWEGTVLDDTEKRSHHIEHGCPLGTFIIGDESVIEPFENSIPGIQFAWSFRDGFDVFLKDVTKKTSVDAVLKKYGWNWDNVIAFGDAGNDTPFIEPAAIGVAMGNAKDDVKKHCDIVAPACDQDGVAKVLEDLELI
ncbi:MAG: Cof-type HAD-IIB family hydrolase [Solobacterium sp.]|jgi:Cof subfamily protein (haloacid dehalogenase superfamily)|nr:Cof-type HAD-IIB family hydrolase [Solobacterium sp.]MCH4206431.1 Cof-type HAD-IIB family hydrolase [Solobacterium sp.]MCH4227937.1 Cof-type HAD-IIB family hydrolase [Solobacterium sp.]MCH4283356.1 Cof-type HAD-IIB family hydrolase [Solobacterium sp.]